MATAPPVIVDTNIFFSALLSERSRFAEIIQRSSESFFICEYVIIELFKHKERIASRSKLSTDDLLSIYYLLLRKVTIYQEALISPANRRSAQHLCRGIDENDIPHIALTLELGGLLWTSDQKLKIGLQAKGFHHFFVPPIQT
ncbi:MAG: PIN domain-containing protein [Caldilineaceae bacterium]|nr:PIN domain-containing protein [Caldilineaceae bacterium]